MADNVEFIPPTKEIEMDCPVKPVGWRVVVRPYRPEEKSAGGLVMPEEVLDNTEILTYVGQIVAMGNLAFTAKTRSGIDMAQVEPRPKVGDWVMYGTYGGQKLSLRNGNNYIVMNDDGIMAIARDPNEFRIYV